MALARVDGKAATASCAARSGARSLGALGAPAHCLVQGRAPVILLGSDGGRAVAGSDRHVTVPARRNRTSGIASAPIRASTANRGGPDERGATCVRPA